MKKKIKILEKLKALRNKVFSAEGFKGKIIKRKKADDNKLSVSEEKIEIEGVEIIEGDAYGELTSKTKMKRWKKALLITAGVIASLAVIIIIVYVSLVNSGKRKLYAGATSEKPNFRPVENETDSNGGIIKDLDMSVDENGNVVIFEGKNDKENGGANNETNTPSGSNNNSGNTQNNLDLKNHTVSFEGVSENSNYDIIFDGVKYAYNKDIITLLFLGIDKLDEVKPAKDGVSGGQADTIFLLVINPHTKVMDILAIHRNSIALVDIYDRSGNYSGAGYTQICLQHAYGGGMEKSNQMTMKSVSRMLYNLPIHSVTSINMGAIPELNDSIGGVTLKSIETFEHEGYSFKEGENVTLKGKGAFAYINYRNLYVADSAGMRLNRQKQYMTQFIDVGMAQIKSNVGKVIDVYGIIKKYVVTDLGVDKMTYLASELINYKFGGIYSFEGELDKNPKWKYERYNLDQDKMFELLISKFYEKVG